MHITKAFPITILVFVTLYTGIQAQSLYLKDKNGDLTTYELDSIQKITFSGENLLITSKNNNTNSINVGFIRHLSFNDFTNYNHHVIKVLDKTFISPNPVNEEMTILFPTYQDAPVEIHIINMEGKIVQKQHFQIQSAYNQIRVNTSSLTYGLYFCRIINKEEVRTLKFFKNR